MTAGAHDAGGGFGRSAGTSAARGVAVIAVAVIVGLLLMRQGLGERSVVAAETSDVTTAENSDGNDANIVTDDTTVSTEPEVEEPTPTTPPPVVRPPAEVKVLVVNGTAGIKGVAKRGADLVSGQGYVAADPKNADIDGASVILYIEGYEADARALATVFGVDPNAVVQPFDPATSPIADTQGANLIVRVGNDGVIQV